MPSAWEPPPGARVNLTLVREERVDPPDGPRSWRRVEVNLAGPWGAGGGAELRVQRIEVTRRDMDEPVVELVGGETPADLSRLSRGDLVLLGVISALRGSTLEFTFDRDGGLADIGGLAEKLEAALPGDDPANDVCRRVFDSERWLTALRAAGMGEVPPRPADHVSERERRSPVDVPGRGTTEVVLTGRMAEEADGSPVLQLTGGVSPGATFTGAAEDLPAVLGPIDLGSVESRAETMYLLDTARPLRGSYTVRMRFRAGHEATEHVSFTLLVTR